MEGERDKGEWLVTGAWLTTSNTLTSLAEIVSHQGGEEGLRVLREREREGTREERTQV